MPQLQAADYYWNQQRLTVTTVAAARKIWKGMDDDFDRSWSTVGPALLETVQLGRTAVARTSMTITADLLTETDQVAPSVGAVNPAAFVIAAPDGRSMGSLLNEAVIQTKMAVVEGQSTGIALATGEQWLTQTLLTVMADTGRGVVSADIASRPALAGFVRVLNPPSCPRCVILAGKWFRWNEGFLRHPRCDCKHVPAGNENWAKAEGFITDPYEYFHSMPTAEQDRVWGRIDARAIRDGADIYRVENIKLRGLATAKGKLRYGTPSRRTVDDIYRTAGTRANAIRMMQDEGFITGPQTRGGNILGAREGFGQLGKGGQAKAATEAVTAARATGVRDPLNRYTMTAAERRLYDANYRLREARATGNFPRSIGANSADKFTRPVPITPKQLATLERDLQNELKKLANAPASVKRLAKLLGLS